MRTRKAPAPLPNPPESAAMVHTTIVRSPNAHPPRHPEAQAPSRRPASLEEHGSLLGTILMVIFSLALMSWVLLGVA